MALLTTLLQLSSLLGFTWWLLAQFRDAHVAPPVLAAVFVSWVLGFLVLLLLPIDLAQNGFPALTEAANVLTAANATVDAGDTTDSANSDRTQLLWTWQVLYWLSFLLSWVALPFLTELDQSGEFVLEQRVKHSLKRFVLNWSLVGAGGAAALAYLVFVGHFSVFGAVGLAMATSNAYGLLGLVVLLGYGLVDVPRSLYALRCPSRQLQALYFRAVYTHADHEAAFAALDDVVDAVHDCYDRLLQAESVAIILTGDMQFVKTCLSQVQALAARNTSARRLQRVQAATSSSSLHQTQTSAASWSMMHSTSRRTSAPVFNSLFASAMCTPTLDEVVALHSRVKQALAERRRTEHAWIELCVQAELLQTRAARCDLLPSSSAVHSTTLVSVRRCASEIVIVTCTGVCAAASTIIVWSECMIPLPSSDALSLVHAVVQSWGSSAAELLVFALLLYAATCASTSLLNLQAVRKYALQSHQSSTTQSLLHMTLFQTRLQFALAYNVVLLLHDTAATDRTAFAALWTPLRVVHVLGRGFATHAPLLLVALAVLTLVGGSANTGAAHAMLERLGMARYEQLQLDNAEHIAQIATGEALVQHGIEHYRGVVRRRKHSAMQSSYGFGTASAGAQALLLDSDDEEGTDGVMECGGNGNDNAWCTDTP